MHKTLSESIGSLDCRCNDLRGSMLINKDSRATLACLYRTLGRFYMLQLNSVDSGHFIQLELSIGWSDLHEIIN